MVVTLCSTDIKWEDKASNFQYLEALFSKFSFTTDLVVLPEMFSTGFTMNVTMAENIDESYTLGWMQRMAAKYNFALLGSFPLLSDNNLSGKKSVVNRAFFVFPDGSFKYYDKRHLFRMGEENSHYHEGKQKCIVEYKGVKFLLNICYDLRFPVWSRNISNEYDVLVNIANFPASRANVIEPLCRARAIENLSYMIFVNRTGTDPQCKYIESSYIFDYKGDNIGIRVDEFDVQVINSKIDVYALNNFREKFPAWMDSDKFEIIV